MGLEKEILKADSPHQLLRKQKNNKRNGKEIKRKL